jgi:hypothetical protein
MPEEIREHMMDISIMIQYVEHITRLTLKT